MLPRRGPLYGTVRAEASEARHRRRYCLYTLTTVPWNLDCGRCALQGTGMDAAEAAGAQTSTRLYTRRVVHLSWVVLRNGAASPVRDARPAGAAGPRHTPR